MTLSPKPAKDIVPGNEICLWPILGKYELVTKVEVVEGETGSRVLIERNGDINTVDDFSPDTLIEVR